MTSKILVAIAATTMVASAGSAMSADLIIDTPAEPIAVSAPGDWYVSLFAGGVWSPEIEADYNDDVVGYDITTDLGLAFGIAVGTKVFENVRIEAELSGTVNSISEAYEEDDDFLYPDFDGSVSALYLLGNVWFDLDTGSGFTPYIGGGVGVAGVDVNFEQWDWELDGGGFAYQLGAGVKVDVADNIALDLGYRFKSVPGVTVDDVDGDDDWLTFDLQSHVFQAGLTFSF